MGDSVAELSPVKLAEPVEVMKRGLSGTHSCSSFRAGDSLPRTGWKDIIFIVFRVSIWKSLLCGSSVWREGPFGGFGGRVPTGRIGSTVCQA